MKDDITTEKVRVAFDAGGSDLWLIKRNEVPFAQVEKFKDDKWTRNPFKVFACDHQGCRAGKMLHFVYPPHKCPKSAMTMWFNDAVNWAVKHL